MDHTMCERHLSSPLITSADLRNDYATLISNIERNFQFSTEVTKRVKLQFRGKLHILLNYCYFTALKNFRTVGQSGNSTEPNCNIRPSKSSCPLPLM